MKNVEGSSLGKVAGCFLLGTLTHFGIAPARLMADASRQNEKQPESNEKQCFHYHTITIEHIPIDHMVAISAKSDRLLIRWQVNGNTLATMTGDQLVQPTPRGPVVYKARGGGVVGQAPGQDVKWSATRMGIGNGRWKLED